MKKYFWYPVAAIACILAIPVLPVILINKDKWNKLGEKIDNAFGFKSPYTRNKENRESNN
ncbi:MAG: hypothetical protein [Wendovervirus sonii]|uniref:Uncharacterized protein n=1 Tax=phage Lak_Megaphage_Sonny TaxID=3109229 RepID=A0ABZ0Z5J4_9CAUD|nr:MAG: hypothetical protein [phage Lak_Megaphage_Sonny]